MGYRGEYLKDYIRQIKYTDMKISGIIHKVGYIGDPTNTNSHVSLSKMRDLFFDKCVAIEELINEVAIKIVFYNTYTSNINLKFRTSIFKSNEEGKKDKKIIHEVFELAFLHALKKWFKIPLDRMLKIIYKSKINYTNISFFEKISEWTEIKDIRKKDFDLYRNFRNKLAHPQLDMFWEYNFRNTIYKKEDIAKSNEIDAEEILEVLLKVEEWLVKVNYLDFFYKLKDLNN